MSRCPNTVYGQHGPTDAKGKCPWCGRKVEAAVSRPDGLPVSEATDSYDYFYDPDYGRPEK